MDILPNSITLIYYVLVAYVSVIMIYNLIKSKSWEKEVLYIIVLLPFLLRLFRLK
jgi:hypothetical protein